MIYTNTGNEQLEAACVSYASREPFRQFGRVVRVPPASRRRIDYRLRLPERVARAKAPLAVKTQLLRVTRPTDSRLGRAHDSAARDGHIILDSDVQTTAILADDPQSELLARVARVMAGLSSRLYRLRDDWTMPSSVDTLRSLDHLVIASNRFLEDPQAVVTVRRWLQQGGRVWVLLDETGPETLAALLGDAWTGARLDETTSVQFQLRDVRPIAGNRHGKSQLLSEPVSLAQVHPGDGAVDYVVANGVVDSGIVDDGVVDSWPAAIRYRVGRGMVLITTLGARGWYAELPRDLLEGIADRRVAQQLVKQSARMPLSVVARNFFKPLPPLLVAPASLRSAASQRIGYRAPSRWLVATILGSLGGGLLLIGVFLQRRQKSAWNVVLAPGAALLATCVMALAGRASRTATPPTLASVEIVSLSPESHEFFCQAGLALFRPHGKHERVEGQGSLCEFNFAGQEGQVQRIFWTDVQDWHLERVEIPSGLSTGQQLRQGLLPAGFAAQATLSAVGLVGRVNLPAEIDSASAVVMTGFGPALAAQIQSDGQFAADARNTLPAHRFSSAALLDDEARRREGLLQQLLGGSRRPSWISAPTLLVWTKAWESGLSLEATESRKGDSIVITPLQMTRPAAGAVVQVPASMIPFQAVAGPDGSAPTSAYSNADRAWVESLSRAARITLRFQLPHFLLPAKVERATLATEIHAPARSVEFLGWHGSRSHRLAQRESPVRQRISITTEDAESLQLDAAGGLLLTIDVGPHSHAGAGGLAAAGWRIANVFLTAKVALSGE